MRIQTSSLSASAVSDAKASLHGFACHGSAMNHSTLGLHRHRVPLSLVLGLSDFLSNPYH